MNPSCLAELMACRLIPLDKGDTKEGKPGVRPIGVDEVLRRLIGKLIIGVIKEDIITTAGPLHACSGVKAGIESAIHAMRKVSEDDDMEDILLVDAESTMHSTILKQRHYCRIYQTAVSTLLSVSIPSIHTYQKPAKMVIADSEKA